jgi:hypothetical protein
MTRSSDLMVGACYLSANGNINHGKKRSVWALSQCSTNEWAIAAKFRSWNCVLSLRTSLNKGI